MINYTDRINISAAGPEIAHAFDLGPGVMGVVFACFFYAYVPCLIPAGILTDKWGAGNALGAGMVFWAIASAMTGAAMGLTSLIVARLLLGAGESSSYSAGNRIVREWAPRSERGVMTATFVCGATAGPALGYPIVSYLIATYNWRVSFYVLAALTLAWVGVWFLVYRSPERLSWLGKEERDYILTNREPISTEKTTKPVKVMTLPSLLRQPAMWGLAFTNGSHAYSVYLFLTWLPSYLRNVRHVDLFAAGWLATLPYAVTTVGMIVLSFLSDYLLKGVDLSTGARRYLMFVFMLLASCVILIPFTENMVLMEILVCCSIMFAMTANSLNYALAGDLIHDKSSAGTVFSITLVGGNIFGIIAPMLTGFIIAWTHEYTMSFVVAGALMLLGIAVSWILVRRPLQPVQAHDVVTGQTSVA
jgi:ACS family glucarate transporter-like MFS transporter